MLISYAEAIKQDERIAGASQVIPSFVWLQSLNEANRSPAAILPKFIESLCFEIGSVTEDRETEICRSVLKIGKLKFAEVLASRPAERDMRKSKADRQLWTISPMMVHQ